MAHAPEPNVQTTYLYAQKWKDNCLLGSRSVFQPDQQLWTAELLEEFKLRFVENPLTGGGTFSIKYLEQLAPGSSALKQLGAELL